MEFQFLYGAIKSIGFGIGGLVINLFQFLYGAIKSDQLKFLFVVGFQFQFLYGAIKSAASATIATTKADFNSSMVRLKVLKGNIDGMDLGLFQFLYGAIKSSQSTKKAPYGMLFQFLYGAIKSWL